MRINLKKKIRQTLKSMERAKAACRKKYIDWEDNCFNCLIVISYSEVIKNNIVKIYMCFLFIAII